MTARAPQREAGVSALELAILLPALLMVLYGLVLFSVMFAVKSTVAHAAAEGARAALEYQAAEDTDAAVELRRARAQQECDNAGAWLSAIHSEGYVCTAAAAACSYNADLHCVTVTARYDYPNYPIVPMIGLLGDATLPLLTSTAESQLNTRSLL